MNLPMRRTIISAAMACALALAAGSGPVGAITPQVRVIPGQDLRFGTFAVPTSGYRIVSPAGAVQDSGIFTTMMGDSGPARFTVAYDRGNNGRNRLDITIHLVFSPPPAISSGGLTARLSALTSDLPNAPLVVPGQVIEIRLPDCRVRVCQTSFQLGGRLDIDRSFGGGPISIAIPVDASVVSVR